MSPPENTNHTIEECPVPGLETASAGQALTGLLRRFFACNPLYLASAGLLLYGVNRLSCDPTFAGAETAQITFNFAALFLYEVLLVVTAIVLARREIWYDALLLVALENLFVLLPFSLVSRAVQLDEPLARKMCTAAAVLAALKLWGLKRYIPRLNLPPRLLAIGGIVLTVNVALALFLRHLSDDPSALGQWISFGWLAGLPLLLALVNLLPDRAAVADVSPANKWLPAGACVIWVAVTTAHLAGVGYVFSYEWRWALLAPLFWVAAWSVGLRIGILAWDASSAAGKWMPILPLAATVLALGDDRIFPALSLLNAFIFGTHFFATRQKRFLMTCLVSFALAMSGIPGEWLAACVPWCSRVEWVIACMAGILVWPLVLSRRPRHGLAAGALCLGIGVLVSRHAMISPGWAFEFASAFVIIHSLRWQEDAADGAAPTRALICIGWVMQSTLWTQFDGTEATLSACFFGGTVALACFGRWFWTQISPPAVICVSSAAVLFVTPCARFAGKVKAISPGYLAVLASFILFGLGTFAALTRKRWNK